MSLPSTQESSFELLIFIKFKGICPSLILDGSKNNEIIMEFAGVTLRDLHKQGKHQFSKDEIGFIACNLIGSIETVHNAGFIH